jgi:hypothetical protein
MCAHLRDNHLDIEKWETAEFSMHCIQYYA